MTEYAERVPVHNAAPSELAAEEEKILTKPHGRQILHAVITVILFGLYLWPGGLLVNHVEPRIFGFPFYVFWVLILLPTIQFINLVLYAQYMIARERQLKTRKLEPWQ